MGRSNAIILAIGLLACVALSVMMQHVVGVADRRRPPEIVVAELDRLLGSRLAAPSTLSDTELGGQPVAFLTIHPAAGVEFAEVANAAGDQLWRRRPDAVAVVVDCVRAGVPSARFQVPSPKERRADPARPVSLAPIRADGAVRAGDTPQPRPR